MLSGISMCQPIDANLDACAPRTVAKRVDPVAVYFGRFDEHACIVAHGIHRSRARGNAFSWGGHISSPHVPPQNARGHPPVAFPSKPTVPTVRPALGVDCIGCLRVPSPAAFVRVAGFEERRESLESGPSGRDTAQVQELWKTKPSPSPACAASPGQTQLGARRTLAEELWNDQSQGDTRDRNRLSQRGHGCSRAN